MKNNRSTYYLALFLIVDLVMAGVLLCFFSHKAWWNNWMVTIPNLYMVLGAFYCPLMKKNLDAKNGKQAWLFIYKGIKLALTVVMLVVFILLTKRDAAFGKQSAIAFTIITAIAYFIGLIIETYCFLNYQKHRQK